jgi:hypothetical protein
MYRLVGALAIATLSLFASGCSSVNGVNPSPVGTCTALQLSGETEFSMPSWRESTTRVVGLGTFKCDFAGSVEVTFPKHISESLDHNGNLIYSGNDLPQIGIIAETDLSKLLGDVSQSQGFEKNKPFQVLSILSAQKTINFLDISSDEVGLMFSNDLGGKPVTKNKIIKLKIGF